MTGPTVILTLKVLVSTVTVLLLASLAALAAGRPRLHGRINIVFFTLTMTTVLSFEVVLSFLQPELRDYFNRLPYMRIHLFFSISTTVLMPVMLFTGLTRRRRVHLTLGIVFGLLWLGTFITGVFFLPHTEL